MSHDNIGYIARLQPAWSHVCVCDLITIFGPKEDIVGQVLGLCVCVCMLVLVVFRTCIPYSILNHIRFRHCGSGPRP